MDAGPVVAALRSAPCPAGRACLMHLSDRVLGAFVQTVSRFNGKGHLGERSVWLENYLRQAHVTADGDVSVSGVDVCISCFTEMCELQLLLAVP